MTEHFQIAKRDNNPIRDYLIINKFQSKHFPSDPRDTVLYSERLGRDMRELCPEGRCLVIVFAETAVGIGTIAASELGERCFLISTTREKLPEWCESITFEETHSHAPTHKLAKLPAVDFAEFEHVFIIDDELTTGKTVGTLAKILFERGAKTVSIHAFLASRASAKTLSEIDVEVHAVYFYDELPELGFPEKFADDEPAAARKPDFDISLNSVYDIRLGAEYSKYMKECRMFCGAAYTLLKKALEGVSGVEVIGTEECCVIPTLFGEMLADDGYSVKVHGVTRSPILPADSEDYPIRSRSVLRSLYEDGRRTFLYNKVESDLSIIFTDAEDIDESALRELCGACGGRRAAVVRLHGRTMRSSLDRNDCHLLLKDVTGTISPMPPEERREKMRSGVHYSELLPEEYIPGGEYIRLYEEGLKTWGRQTAEAVRDVSEKILLEKGRDVVLVSLARAGTPAGVLVKRYLERVHGIRAPHYSVSIIRGVGIDKAAMKYILARHRPESIQFIDGWTGKGAITRQLAEALGSSSIDPRPAVLADPAGVCGIYGTREDIFIPCSCLNGAVSGLFSRTVLKSGVIGDGDFHGAAYLEELAEHDRTYEFINAIERESEKLPPYVPSEAAPADGGGLKEAERIAEAFGVTDINLVKPSIGEAARVLLRRVPEVILLKDVKSPLTLHLAELAREKGVEVREYPLERYHAVGIIKN